MMEAGGKEIESDGSESKLLKDFLLPDFFIYLLHRVFFLRGYCIAPYGVGKQNKDEI